MPAAIRSAKSVLPRHYVSQEELLHAVREGWAAQTYNPERLEQFHRAARVGGRYLALPLSHYRSIGGFSDANRLYIECATDLGQRAVEAALGEAGLPPEAIDHLLFVTTTGIAVPSIDARLMNRVGFRNDVRRTPIFGLGCAGGAAGIARASDLLRRGENALLLSVELCSLTFQRGDLSFANLVASGLFGDGAAAVVLGEARGLSPVVAATRSCFYPQTERVMGWDVGADGFRVVLSASVPEAVRDNLRRDVDHFLGELGLRLQDVRHFVCHPGGPKVLEAIEESLERPRSDFRRTWRSLHEVGNLSSASVLLVLERTLEEAPARAGDLGLLLAMGPGFCSELVLLRWEET